MASYYYLDFFNFSFFVLVETHSLISFCFSGSHPQPQKPLGTFCSAIFITSFSVKYLRNGLSRMAKKIILLLFLFR